MSAKRRQIPFQLSCSYTQVWRRLEAESKSHGLPNPVHDPTIIYHSASVGCKAADAITHWFDGKRDILIRAHGFGLITAVRSRRERHSQDGLSMWSEHENGESRVNPRMTMGLSNLNRNERLARKNYQENEKGRRVVQLSLTTEENESRKNKESVIW